uniref:Uncharacterized protein LOC105113295 isoform X2 n=1 Tax=Rhizophora mucronata TaxID=61149 RepID=A0A2P2QD93_RHIMU
MLTLSTFHLQHCNYLCGLVPLRRTCSQEFLQSNLCQEVDHIE